MSKIVLGFGITLGVIADVILNSGIEKERKYDLKPEQAVRINLSVLLALCVFV